MGNIFTILLRIFPFLVFVGLEIFSFYTISCYNDFYKSNFVSRSNSIVGGFHNKINSINDYFTLEDVNEKLLAENTLLKNQLNLYQQSRQSIQDDSTSAVNQNILPNYSVIQSRVIKNSISHLRNYILVNKGSKDGIVKDMSAISDKGPVGIVIEVSENYSCIMSFINKDAVVSARVKSNNLIGQLKWSGSDVRIANLEEIPKHIKLKVGDEIITSGHSNYFPEGIPIGKVLKQVDSKKSNFADIKVLLYNDFASLKYLYLIKNKNQSEMNTMETKILELQNAKSNDQ